MTSFLAVNHPQSILGDESPAARKQHLLGDRGRLRSFPSNREDLHHDVEPVLSVTSLDTGVDETTAVSASICFGDIGTLIISLFLEQERFPRSAVCCVEDPLEIFLSCIGLFWSLLRRHLREIRYCVFKLMCTPPFSTKVGSII